MPLTQEVDAFIDELLRGRPSEFPSVQELNDLILGRFSHLIFESSGTIEEVNPSGSSFEEALRSYRSIICSIPQPTSSPMYEVADQEEDIDALSGHSEPEGWDLQVDSEQPYVWTTDFSSYDIQVGDTVLFLPVEDDWTNHDPLDHVPYPGPNRFWQPGAWLGAVTLREGCPGSMTLYYIHGKHMRLCRGVHRVTDDSREWRILRNRPAVSTCV